ncbi:undecaprenyl-diphosphate phosphatase [Microbaculum marinisediminis]|uniref:Undecaprenyl-diphosphatase n=1 Tax=Microbaculum marinisediminis TaxID=2931392 RepID=A0AAW5QSK5_9HYPH|nr:undecaprenyl-diphosphate phosphatase [Microbaculum sp. A6E488]MCT8970862.1 undecaprenyl-diphosphate phosphatase [Microbaculum sp. A6E488]
MTSETIIQAAFLGLIEGLTEFIPVSSTAHLLLVGHFLGFENPGRAFEVLIQLGAIFAVVGVYFTRLLRIALALPSDPKARKFVIGVVLAFLPAAVVGVLLHDFIKSVLFESPVVICVTLIVGGLLLMWLDSMDLRPRYTEATDYPLSLYFKIGVFQCLAMVPGVSRSGATIGGALLMGADKRSAAEFSFFLAMPTMAGAFAYDLYKNIDVLGAEDAKLIAVGFVMSMISGVIVVRTLLDFVSRHGFAPFAWWRIIVGSAGLAGLWVYG